MKHLGSTIRANLTQNKNQAKKRHLQARFTFRQQEKQQNNTKRGRSHNQKHPHQETTGFALDTEGKPNVSLKSALRN